MKKKNKELKIFYIGNYYPFIDFSNYYKDRIGWRNMFYSPCFPYVPIHTRSSLGWGETIIIPVNDGKIFYQEWKIPINKIIVVFGHNIDAETKNNRSQIIRSRFRGILDMMNEDTFKKSMADRYFPTISEIKLEKCNRFEIMEIG